MNPLILTSLPPVLPGSSSASAGSATGSGTFGHLLAQAITSLTDSQSQANTAIQQAMDGQGTVTGAMVAMVEAQSSLDVAVAFRNNAVQAYQTVMNMPLS